MKNIFTTAIAILIGLSSFAQVPIIYDVEQGGDDSYPYSFKQIGDNLYFYFYDNNVGEDRIGYIDLNGNLHKPHYNMPSYYEIYGFETEIIYEYNGSAYFIQVIYDDNEGDYYNFVSTVVNDTVVFINTYDFEAYGLAVYDNYLYVTGYTDSTGMELFKYDGASLALDYDLIPGANSSEISGSIYVANDKLLFTYSNDNGDRFIGEYDGTTIISDTISDNMYYLYPPVSVNDTIVFNVYSWSGEGLYYLVNGEVTELLLTDYQYTTLTNVGGKVYGVYHDYMLGENGLAYFDMANNQLVEIAAPSTELEPDHLVSYQNQLFFIGNSSPSGYFPEIGMVDPVTDIMTFVTIPNQAYGLYDLTLLENELYFNASINGGVGAEPYRYNNGSPVLVYDVVPGSEWDESDPEYFAMFEGNLVFSGYTMNQGREVIIICQNNEVPTASATQLLCENSEIADLVVNGTNLTWYASPTGSNSVSVNTQITADGSYYVESTILCPSARVEVPFTVSMLPDNAAAFLGFNDIMVLNPTDSYQWIDCATGNDLVGETNQTLTVTSNGAYKCLLTNADGCTVETSCIYVVNLGVEENVAGNVTIYPNPTSTVLNFNSSELMGDMTVSNLSGQVIETVSVNGSTFTMATDKFVSGVYFVQIFNTSGVLISNQKVVVNK